MLRPLLCFITSFLMELVWAVSTMALQHRLPVIAFGGAFAAPFITGVAQALTVVDEEKWSQRFLNMTWYAMGACAGLAVALWGW